MFNEPPIVDAPARRTPRTASVLLVVVIIAALTGTAHVAGMAEVPGLPGVVDGPTEHAGWVDPAAPTPETPDVETSPVHTDSPSAGDERTAPAPTAPADPGAAEPSSTPDTSSASAPAVHPEEQSLVLSGAAPGGDDQVFYVDRSHPYASDTNAGTSEDAPWRTVVHAAETVRAGQTVYVKRGVYDDGRVELTHSGTAAAPIVLSAYPGDERKAELTGEGFRAEGRSHFELRGFKITHTSAHGIRLEGPESPTAPPATDIVISGNHTHDTCRSAISVWGADWGDDPGDYDNIRNVDIADNLIELGANGCTGEVVTVAGGAINVDVHHNIVRMGDPTAQGGDEGIDFKEGVRDSRIFANEIYGLSDKAIYIDGGSADDSATRLANDEPFVRNIEIFDNHIHDLPSAGISIVTEGKGDVDGISVFNNVIHDVDGDGILVYDHPGGREMGGTVRDVHIVNNTTYYSGLRHGGHGGIRVNHPRATGVVIRNNIAWNNNGFDIRGEAETTIDHNLCREAHCETTTGPKFAGPARRDLHLTTASPALDAGSDAGAPATDREGTLRPTGRVDLGAFERPAAITDLPRIVPGFTSVAEGHTGTVELVIPVSLTTASPSEVTASWQLHSYQADAGTDVIDASGTITFAAGQTETTVVVEVIGDTAAEDDEWVIVAVRDPEGAVLGGLWGLGLGLITDDD